MAEVQWSQLQAAPRDELSARTFGLLAGIIYKHSRICLGPDKHALLANRLRGRIRECGLADFDEYHDLLESSAGGTEIDVLIDLVSTNHTNFFREIEHFRFLSTKVLPEVIASCRANGKALRLWSAAASSGEEPYTMALVVAEFLRTQAPLDWQIHASDISRRMLATAARGIYSQNALDAVPPGLLRRYFERGIGVQAGSCRVQASIRARVLFEHINLFQPHYPLGLEQQVIFCRNVMIYFDEPSRIEALQKITRHLAPGGYLVIGYSESILGLPHGLEPVTQGIFRKA